MILAVCQTRSLRSPSNLFLVNLAVSDLLLVSLACPATLAQLAASSWPLPPVPELCRCYVSRVTCHASCVMCIMFCSRLATFLPLLFSFASAFRKLFNTRCVHSLDAGGQQTFANLSATIALCSVTKKHGLK